MLLPKCLLCLAASFGAFTGVALPAMVASNIPPFLFIACALPAFLLVRCAIGRFRVFDGRPTAQTDNLKIS